VGRVEDRVETLEQKQKWSSILHSSLIIALLLMNFLDTFDGAVEISMLIILGGTALYAAWAAFRLYAIDTGSSGEGMREGDTSPPTAGGGADE
jgi:hypothetical protein